MLPSVVFESFVMMSPAPQHRFSTLTSYFAPDSTGSLTLPRTIGRTYGWVTLTIRSATRCFFSSNISFCWA